MGVQVSITLYAPTEEKAEAAASAAFQRFAELEDIMSDYRPSSELMRLCAKAGGPAVKVSPDLYRVLRFGRQVSKRSDGAFDVTVGPLVQLWRASRKSGQLPAESEIERAKALAGWRKVLLKDSDRSVRLAVPGMRLDLGGIAKGYAGDEAVKALKRKGIRSAMVEAGGDIVLSGAPPGTRGWRIEIPAMSAGSRQPTTLELSNCAVSTSGDLYQFVEIGGKRYSHIVDPRTGLGLTDRIAVTIIAPNGITSDPLSTAVSVLGDRDGRKLARSFRGVRAFVRHAQ